MTREAVLIIVVGGFAGGFVNGLSGFGLGLTALGIWLHAVPPAMAATLAVAMSVLSQLQTLPLAFKSFEAGNTLRFVLPGLVAVPLGVLALAVLEPRPFKIVVGLFLVLYSAYALSRGVARHIFKPALPSDVVVGFAGGFLGGLAGLSGALMALWTDIRGDAKDARRSLLQTFNLSVLSVALVSHAVGGHITRETMLALAIAAPGTVAGAWTGAWWYKRLADNDFRRIVLLLLLVSGLVLLVGS